MTRRKIVLGKKSIVGKHVVLGAESTKTSDLGPLVIGEGALIRSSTVMYLGNRIGKNFRTGHGVIIRENNRIGDNVSVGSLSEIGRENIIEDNVRIHSLCFIPEYVRIEKGAWLGPRTTILNILHPPCPKFSECAKGIVIGEGAKIGGGVIIGPRVRIGKNALVGAGSIVTRNVPDNSVAYGNPAKIVKKVRELKCVLGFYDAPYEWER